MYVSSFFTLSCTSVQQFAIKLDFRGVTLLTQSFAPTQHSHNAKRCFCFLGLSNKRRENSSCYVNSVTRWLDYFPTFGHLQQWTFAQLCNKFAKVGSTFCRIRNKPLKICQRLFQFCQSGKISPNLVTLVVGPFLYRKIQQKCSQTGQSDSFDKQLNLTTSKSIKRTA